MEPLKSVSSKISEMPTGKLVGIILLAILSIAVATDLIVRAFRRSAPAVAQVVDHSQPTLTPDPNWKAPTPDPNWKPPPTPRPQTAAEIQAGKVASRKLYIRNAEVEFLDKGIDVYLSLKGKNQDELQMRYILMSRPMVHQLSKDEGFLSTVRRYGFRKVHFTDGYDDRWTMDLE